MLGRRIATPQTPEGGALVKWVYVEEAVEAAQLLYAAVLLDRVSGRPLVLASAHGGDDIEDRAERDPGIIQSIPLTLRDGTADGDFAGLATRIGLTGAAMAAAAQLFRQLAAAFVGLDATLIEVNPLALTAGGHAGRARCQAQHRRQRAVPPRRPARLARLHGAGRERSHRAGGTAAPDQLHPHGRRHRRAGERRRPGAGDPGHGVRCRWPAGQLHGHPHDGDEPRHRARLPADPRQPGRAVDPGQHPRRRHAAVRHRRRRYRHRRAAARSLQPGRDIPIVICMAGNHAEFARTVLANTGVPHIACRTPWEAVQKAVACAKAESSSWLSSLVARRA